jgi:two-component system, NarL family, invasion response regulator UvrY
MKILIADDHPVVREGVKQIIRELISFSNIEDASNGDEALHLIEMNEYDLVILDISMPGKNGLDILKALKDKSERVPILVLSIHQEEQYAIRALKLGASGYICKDSVYEEMAVAIKKIMAGEKYISSALAEKIVFDNQGDLKYSLHEKLSDREFQIMRMLAKGKSLNDIADELFISNKTVSTYRARLLEKMGMRKNAELTLYAIKNNLIE